MMHGDACGYETQGVLFIFPLQIVHQNKNCPVAPVPVVPVFSNPAFLNYLN